MRSTHGPYNEAMAMYVVVEDGGRQYRVAEGDEIELDYRETPVGETITLERVLFSGGEQTHVGTPVIEGAVVVAEVLGPVKGPKLRIQKFRRRKNYRRRTGHRQRYTAVRIREIRLPETSGASVD